MEDTASTKRKLLPLVCLRNSEAMNAKLAVKGASARTLVREPLMFPGWTKGKQDVMKIQLTYQLYLLGRGKRSIN